jgi:hypothetical protein
MLQLCDPGGWQNVEDVEETARRGLRKRRMRVSSVTAASQLSRSNEYDICLWLLL